MCVHVFSHLGVVNWILDHAAWDSWHPPLPEPVGPEPRAPAPPNILREPCEAENLRVCFFSRKISFFWHEIHMNHMIQKDDSHDLGFSDPKSSQFRRGMRLDILGRLVAAESPMMSRRAYSWLAASCCRASCLPAASQGIARHHKTGWSRSILGPSIESARRETLTWWNYIWHSRFIWVHMGSYGFMFFMFFMFFGSRFPPVLLNRTWLESVAFGKREAFGNPEWTVSASLASPVVDERGARPRHCRPRPAPQVVAKACLGVKWSQDVACTLWTSHTVKFTWINCSDAIFGWIPLPSIVYSDVAVRPL